MYHPKHYLIALPFFDSVSTAKQSENHYQLNSTFYCYLLDNIDTMGTAVYVTYTFLSLLAKIKHISKFFGLQSGSEIWTVRMNRKFYSYAIFCLWEFSILICCLFLLLWLIAFFFKKKIKSKLYINIVPIKRGYHPCTKDLQ